MNGHDFTRFVLLDRGRHNNIAVTEANRLGGRTVGWDCKTAIALGRHFREVITLNPEFAREGDLTGSHLGFLRVIVGDQHFGSVFRIVVNDELERMKHGNASFRPIFQVFSKRRFQNRVVDPTTRHARDTATFGKVLQTFRREAAATQTDDGRHAGIVPTVHVTFRHELDELALAHHHVRKIQAIEFVLVRKQEEIRTNHFERRLKERREIFRIFLQQREESGHPMVFDGIGNRLPLRKNFTNSFFRNGVSQLLFCRLGCANKSHGAVVAAARHGGDDFFCLLKLRRTQNRNDALQRPIVEGTLIFKFERADRVGDVLERVFDWMRKGVHRVDAPLVAGRMVFCKANAVDGRISQIDVGTRHVDLRAKYHAAFGVLAVTHFTEQTQVFFDRTVAVRRVTAGLVQRPAVGLHFFGRLLVHVSVTSLHQMLGKLVHVFKIRAREVEVRFLFVHPVKA